MTKHKQKFLLMHRGDNSNLHRERDRSNGHNSVNTNLTEESRSKPTMIPKHPLNINKKLSLIKKSANNNSSEDIH